MIPDRRIKLITGHYGCGKTNLSLNLAAYYAAAGRKVSLIDLDIVNPYFRSSDYKDRMNDLGIKVISPPSAGTTLDSPYLSPEIFTAIEGTDDVIFDVGGDDAGATALGQFSSALLETGQTVSCYVVNMYRNLSDTARSACEILYETEKASHMKADCIINNSHLSYLTTADDIRASFSYADEVSRISGLPLAMTTSPKSFLKELSQERDDLFGVEIYVRPIWNQKD